MLLSLGEAKADVLGDIAGACTNSPEFLKKLNTATRRLMRRGDFSGTIVPIMVCARRGCVVFNRYVHQVRKLNLCRRQTPIKNFWTDYLDSGWSASWRRNLGRDCPIIAGGQTPVFQDIMGDDRLVRAFPSVQNDVGKVVRIFGTDNNGQPLRYRASDGLWYDGWPITLAIPYGVTTDGAHTDPLPIRKIDRVLLDDMNGIVHLYAFNTATSLLEALGEYMPGETNPQYQSYRLPGCCSGTCSTNLSVIALVKLRYIPARYDTDLVLIENLDSLHDMIQSLDSRDAGDKDAAIESNLSAVRELNHQMEDDFPDSQIPVELGEVTRCVGRQKVF